MANRLTDEAHRTIDEKGSGLVSAGRPHPGAQVGSPTVRRLVRILRSALTVLSLLPLSRQRTLWVRSTTRDRTARLDQTLQTRRPRPPLHRPRVQSRRRRPPLRRLLPRPSHDRAGRGSVWDWDAHAHSPIAHTPADVANRWGFRRALTGAKNAFGRRGVIVFPAWLPTALFAALPLRPRRIRPPPPPTHPRRVLQESRVRPSAPPPTAAPNAAPSANERPIVTRDRRRRPYSEDYPPLFHRISRLIQHFKRTPALSRPRSQTAALAWTHSSPRLPPLPCPPSLISRPFTGAAVPASGLASVQVGDFERIGHP